MRQRSRAQPGTLALLAIAGACSSSPESSDVERNVAMIRAYVEAATRGDATYLDEYLAPDYAYHGPPGELDRGGFTAFHKAILAAFPGGTMTAEDVIAEGDRVATRWTFRGVHRGPFRGIAPTGKEVTLSGIIISRFREGRVVEEWEAASRPGLMEQLGVLTTPEGDRATAAQRSYARIYADSAGHSHFSDEAMELELLTPGPGVPPTPASAAIPATGMRLFCPAEGGEADWHPVPARVLNLILSGMFEIEVSDGEIRRFGPGSLILGEDTSGQGHRTRVLGTEKACFAMVLLGTS